PSSRLCTTSSRTCSPCSTARSKTTSRSSTPTPSPGRSATCCWSWSAPDPKPARVHHLWVSPILSRLRRRHHCAINVDLHLIIDVGERIDRMLRFTAILVLQGHRVAADAVGAGTLRLGRGGCGVAAGLDRRHAERG